MSRFIACDDGCWIGLHHVAKIRKYDRRGGLTAYAFEDADGNVIARDSFGSADVEELTAPVVPAASGATAVVITPCSDSVGGRPDSVWSQRVPIVAWRMMYGGAVPVLIESATADDVVCITLPDGRLLLPEDATFDDVAEAERVILLRAQVEWDRENSKQKVAA